MIDKYKALLICEIYMHDNTGFTYELAKRIRAKIEDLTEFEKISVPTNVDGQYLCKYSEVQECGTNLIKWGVFDVIQNSFIVKGNQKIIEYKNLPNLF